MNIEKFLKSKGYAPTLPPDKMASWLSWYKGNVSEFHEYNVYNGVTQTKRRRETMNMAKQICEDWGSLILNEKVKIAVNDEGYQDLLDIVLDWNHFHLRANGLIELMFALGTAAFVEYPDGRGNVVIDYIRGDMIFPLHYVNGEIVECAFGSTVDIDGKRYYYVNVHELTNAGEYVVRNYLTNEKGDQDYTLPDGILDEIQTGSDVPRFQIIRPNIVNNVDLDSPFGVSVFANSISRLKKVDLIFDSGNNEFALGKKRIFIPVSMAESTFSKAQGQPIFDANDVAFYAYETDEKTMPKDMTTDLRIPAHSQGLQDALNYLSDGVGLGTDRYEYTRGSGAKTATEIISEKSTLYQNLRKHELIIEKAIKDLCRSVFAILQLNPDQEITVNFDDSIIEDTAAHRNVAMMEYQNGLIDEVEYHVKAYGLSEDVALKKVQDMERRRNGMPVEVHTTPFDASEIERDRLDGEAEEA